MRKTTFLSVSLMSLALTLGNQSVSGRSSLDADFQNPPKEIQTSVYWYWISDHISNEGIIKDLHAMKEAGINRAYIGNIGLNDEGSGKVKFGTEEWWDAIHTAMKTATELDIELGVFNSPGWSQSGGPWVKPEQAMRYMTSTTTQIEGGQKLEITLPKPEGYFADVKVLAYPCLAAETNIPLKLTSLPALTGLEKLTDGDFSTGLNLAPDEKKDATLDFTFAQNKTVRTAKIYTSTYSLNTTATLEAKTNGEYVPVANFKLDRYNGALNVGFDPNAPIVISIPPTTSTDFRLIVHNVNPQTGLSEVVLTSTPFVERYPEKSLAKMFQEPLPYWNEYQWPAQPIVDDPALLVDSTKVLDISNCLIGDKLTWNAPSGNWVIMRIGATPTGVQNSPASKEATGLETDKMSRSHIEAHFEAFMGEAIRRIPAKDRKTWKVVVQDSYEMGGQNYTDDLFETFKTRYGYDPVPFLPTLSGVVVQSQDISDRFLWDLRRMIADRVAYDYVGGLRDISHKYGLKTWLECYGHWGFPGEFLQYGGQSDEIGGEFWATGTLGDIENRAASSCGHIYGKQKISAESFTSGGPSYGRCPAQLKQRGDRFFSEGINNTLLHLYILQPYEDKQPGVNAPFGTEFNRFNTWFSQLDLFTTYLKRVNFMLQQGLNVADVAYFIGEDTPKMTGITDPPLPKGYQFDYINAEIIEKSLFVKDGLLTLPHGTQYKMLVLPKLNTMRPELLKKIKQLIQDGAVILGSAPTRSPSYRNYPDADAEVDKLSTEIWSALKEAKHLATFPGSAPYGKGRVLQSMTMEQALKTVKCPPDFQCNTDAPIHYGHRTLENAEVYFICNQTDKEQTFSPEFRAKGLPEWWEPTTGNIRPLTAYAQTETGTRLPVKLAPYESAFIVFRGKAKDFGTVDQTTNFPEPQVIAALNNPWAVGLDNPYLGVKKNLTLPQLGNLAKSDDPDLKYYAGTLTYETDFTLETLPKNDLFINLNEVYVMAKVKINGQYVGGVWTAPYRLNISKAVKKGKNHVEIEVVNTWVNRIIHDLNLPEAERKTWYLENSWNAKSPLQDSGLVGPVVIESISYPKKR